MAAPIPIDELTVQFWHSNGKMAKGQVLPMFNKVGLFVLAFLNGVCFCGFEASVLVLLFLFFLCWLAPLQVVDNLLAFPGEEKYTKIKRDWFAKKTESVSLCVELLTALGFVVVDDLFVFKGDVSGLNAFKTGLLTLQEAEVRVM
jgi:hypothetical protein